MAFPSRLVRARAAHLDRTAFRPVRRPDAPRGLRPEPCRASLPGCPPPAPVATCRSLGHRAVGPGSAVCVGVLTLNRFSAVIGRTDTDIQRPRRSTPMLRRLMALALFLAT